MKKPMGILLAIALLFTGAAALAETDLRQMGEANIIINVLDVYPRVSQNVIFYDLETGEVTDGLTAHNEYDPERGGLYTYMYHNGDVDIFGRGEGYGYIGAIEQPFMYGFILDEYENTMLFCGSQNLGEFEEGQIITAEEISEDGKLLITTEGVISAENALLGEAYPGLTLVVRYTANPVNLIIEASELYIRGDDGAEKLVCTSSLEIDPVIKLPFDLSALKNPEAVREIHVISDMGTDEEFDHVYEAPADAPMLFYLPEGYMVYSDEACTEEAYGVWPEKDEILPASKTLYLKRIE